MSLNIHQQRSIDEACIREALANIGIHTELAQLSSHDYSDELIDTLIELLDTVADPIVKLQLVKALAGPFPKAYRRVEQALLDRMSEWASCLAGPGAVPGMESLLWGASNCLEIVAAPSSPHVARYKAIVADQGFGIARQMLVLTLSKFPADEVEDDLIDLLNDAEVEGHAVMALGRLRSMKALPHLRALESGKRAWVRREVAKSIKLIEASRK